MAESIYEDGYFPPPFTLNMYKLKTLEKNIPLIGKTIKDIKEYASCVLILFTDGSEIEISVGGQFDEFNVDITLAGRIQND